MAAWFSRLERRPVTPEVEGSSPFAVAKTCPEIRGMNFAAIAQQVERILGKDEVPSSNLGSSSKKPVFPFGNAGFFLFVLKFGFGLGTSSEIIIKRGPPVRLYPEGVNLGSSSKSLENTAFSRLFSFSLEVSRAHP